MPQLSFNSPLGALTLTEEDGAILSLDWGWGMGNEETPLLTAARDQVDAYFDRRLTVFDLPLAPPGTAFQKKVWDVMNTIPFGQTLTYGEVATRLGTSPRAVGLACGRNPIPIIIPCHRILGSNGSLGGYSGLDGVETKRTLLRLEKALLA